jgi:hypothetical protein
MHLLALVKRMRAMRRVNIVWVKSIAKERAPKRAPKAVSRFRVSSPDAKSREFTNDFPQRH